MKDIGVDVRAPVGEWDGDQNCPFYGSLRLRGQIIEGTVSSIGMSNSIIVQREVTRYMKKYERYEKRTRRYAAHLPSCIGGNPLLVKLRTWCGFQFQKRPSFWNFILMNHS